MKLRRLDVPARSDVAVPIPMKYRHLVLVAPHEIANECLYFASTARGGEIVEGVGQWIAPANRQMMMMMMIQGAGLSNMTILPSSYGGYLSHLVAGDR